MVGAGAQAEGGELEWASVAEDGGQVPGEPPSYRLSLESRFPGDSGGKHRQACDHHPRGHSCLT